MEENDTGNAFSSQYESMPYILNRGGDEQHLDGKSLRSFVQGILSKTLNLATLIGSGASMPAIPLMSNTFKDLRESLKGTDPILSTDLEERILRLSELKGICPDGFSDIELLLSWLGHRIEGDCETADSDRQLVGILNKRFIDSVCPDYDCPDAITALANYCRVIQGLGISRQILARHGQTVFDIVNLFTTNYDLFHELALERSKFSYADGFTNGTQAVFSPKEFHQRPIDCEDRFREHYQPINPYFRLYKLHGSVNWRVVNGQVTRLSTDDPRNTGRKGEVLIAPTSSKYELTQDEPYSDLFREFVNTLAVPDTVLFTTGFSFGDKHISNLISQSLARTDFTLMSFIGNPKVKSASRVTADFFNSVGTTNGYFVYPDANVADHSRPLTFSEFAYFIGPNPPDHGLLSISEDEGNSNEAS